MIASKKFILKSIIASFFMVFVVVGNAHAMRPDTTIADLSERLLPSVVNISTTEKVVENERARRNPFLNERSPFPEGSPFNDLFDQFFEQYGGQQPQSNPDEQNDNKKPREYNRPLSLGSGFIIDAEKGYIVTNNHVIDGADEIKVTLHDDTTLDAKIIGSDDKTDVALIQVETDHPLKAVPWGSSDDMRVGEWIIAIGNPFGLGGTVTTGIISARQRDINAGPYDDFIQTDASINRGNSGGPMFNMNGEVIGINTAIFSPTGGSVGIGFAIPSQMAKSVVKQLVEFGRTRRGWLGVQIQTVTEDIAESLELEKAQGALVANVTKDSPADKAGYKAGDVILTFDGHEIDQMKSLPRIVAETEIDKTVKSVVWRDGKKQTLNVKVGELDVEEDKPEASAEEEPKEQKKTKEAVSLSKLGLKVKDIEAQDRMKYDLSDELEGVLIVDVDRSYQAARKRVGAGAVVTEFNQKKVKSATDLEKAYEKAVKDGKKTVLLLIDQAGMTRFVALKLEE
ncbi:MAG: serine protease [Rickettsiales bacterium]|nr:serine protease [Rickettsiales bacterium]|tara:strand:+ start:78 stop:1610 length:1533 start_codon:yes stop_codon:yes gene_type:complete